MHFTMGIVPSFHNLVLNMSTRSANDTGFKFSGLDKFGMFLKGCWGVHQ